jgi:hypothetical protein
MRGFASAQITDARISVCHGVGGLFAPSGKIIMSNQPLWATAKHYVTDRDQIP